MTLTNDRIIFIIVIIITIIIIYLRTQAVKAVLCTEYE